mmetsp:Transcript_84170/g.214273  ORF Transcript_84170/g.214273 Transcript_84170/m.214273 type:complete len:213 (+) Transcript_84170:125-763(+)
MMSFPDLGSSRISNSPPMRCETHCAILTLYIARASCGISKRQRSTTPGSSLKSAKHANSGDLQDARKSKIELRRASSSAVKESSGRLAKNASGPGTTTGGGGGAGAAADCNRISPWPASSRAVAISPPNRRSIHSRSGKENGAGLLLSQSIKTCRNETSSGANSSGGSELKKASRSAAVPAIAAAGPVRSPNRPCAFAHAIARDRARGSSGS